jgi:S1-C subfamily serine protease
MASVRSRRRDRTDIGPFVAACGLLVLFVAGLSGAAAAQQPAPAAQVDRRARAATVARKPVATNSSRRRVLPSDNWTYRPTVLIRRGTSQGSGTVIASVEGLTLVLTAAHVLKAEGPVIVELHRYNLGMERQPATPGVWPRSVVATIAATDTAGDLAIVRIDKMVALPYVARLAQSRDDPQPDAVLTSIGIDLGKKLTSWTTLLVETVKFQLNDSHDPRPFLITEKIPEHGRSGGGLFRSDGTLVGVCVGHAELVKGRRMGVFSSAESIRLLLDAHKLTAVVLRSEMRLARLKKGRSPVAAGSAPEPSKPAVTTTRSLDGEITNPPKP